MKKTNLQALQNELKPILEGIVSEAAGVLKTAVEVGQFGTTQPAANLLVHAGLLKDIGASLACEDVHLYAPTELGIAIYTKIYGAKA